MLVAGVADGAARALRLEARPLLGGDVAVRSFQPITLDPEGFSDVRRADAVELFSMAAVPGGGRSTLVELQASSDGFPFYGAPTFDPPGRPADDEVVVDPALLGRLGLGIGDELALAGVAFRIRGVVTAEPGRLPTGLSAGPRVIASLGGLARAGLGTTGARITWKRVFAVPDEARAAALVDALRAEGGAAARIETWADAQPAAQRTIARTSAFLGLVALLSLVVGGVGVAQATRAWVARRLDGFAVLRCLGATSGEVRAIALVQIGLLACAASGLGAALGVVALAAAPLVLAGSIPPGAVSPWQPAAVLRGIALGVGVALLFAARPLARASRVPPLRVLRRDVEPLPGGNLWLLGVAAGLFGFAALQSGDPELAAWFVGGLASIAAAGAVGVGVVTRLLARLAARAPRWWVRHGLAALARPGADPVSAVVSLALGVSVVLTTVLVEGRIVAQIADEFPDGAPSAFLVDVQPDQRDGVLALLATEGASNVRAAPMVVARLVAIDGRSVDDLVAERPDEAWALTREQRLSYMPSLPADNVVVEGAPFSDAVAGELSLEQRYAESLRARPGSRLRFDVQGVPIELVVSSVRTVTWSSFDMNFFLIAEPGVLEDAPQSVLVTAQLPAEREAATQDRLAAAFPNVTLIGVRQALAQARGLLGRMADAVRVVGTFTAAAGVAILLAGVAADAARRDREVALLKTLGTTRAGIVALLGVEYAILGALAGALGAVGAWGTSRGIVAEVLGLPWRTDARALAAGVAAAIVLSIFAGIAANTRAIRVRPAAVLRGE